MRAAAAVRALVLAVLVAACQSDGGAEKSATPEQMSMKQAGPMTPMTAAQLRAVSTDAAFAAPIEISVFAWRDMMPSDREHGGLIVSAQIRGGVTPPAPLRCDGMYLVHGDSVFAARPDEVRDGDGPGAVECLVRNGPGWPAQSTIQVVVSVTGPGGKTAMIRRETTIEEVH
jgi:hypothetical protein